MNPPFKNLGAAIYLQIKILGAFSVVGVLYFLPLAFPKSLSEGI